jgi:hypothetical protein
MRRIFTKLKIAQQKNFFEEIFYKNFYNNRAKNVENTDKSLNSRHQVNCGVSLCGFS